MILFALLLLAGPVDPPAAPTAASPAVSPNNAPGTPGAVTAPTKASYDQQISCRREAQPNSNITKRVCLTNAQWVQRMKEDQDAVKEAQQHALTAAVGGGGHP
jgi:hypothetical protein